MPIQSERPQKFSDSNPRGRCALDTCSMHAYSWKLNRNRANLETEVVYSSGSYTFHSRWMDRYPGKACIYIYIHISTVSSRKLKLLYQTAARLAADFSCNTCLSRDSRVSSRGFPAKLSSLVTRETRVSAENRSKSRWKWLEERMESSIEMKIFDCPDCG